MGNQKFIFAIAASVPFLAGGVLRAAGYTQTVESFGPVGYFQFSSATAGVTNSSVNGYTGTLTNGASLSSPGAGPALADDPNNIALVVSNPTSATSQFVDTNLPGTASAKQISSAGTIVAWINLSQLPSTAGRIFYIAGESNLGDDFDLQIGTDNTIEFFTDGSGHVDTPALTAADLNKWIFVAGTFTADTQRSIYMNGAAPVTSGSGAHSASSNNFSIGASDVFGGRYFDGMIDEVAVYNTALTTQNIGDIYTSASAVPEPASAALLLTPLLGLIRSAPASTMKGLTRVCRAF